MDSLTRFQKYWLDLKVQKPDAYQEKLQRNRERARAYRQRIRDDPEQRAKQNAKRRENYRRKLLNASQSDA